MLMELLKVDLLEQMDEKSEYKACSMLVFKMKELWTPFVAAYN